MQESMRLKYEPDQVRRVDDFIRAMADVVQVPRLPPLTPDKGVATLCALSCWQLLTFSL